MAATGSGHVNHINSAIKPQEHHCLHYCPAVKQTLEGSLETSEWPERSGKYAEEGKREREEEEEEEEEEWERGVAESDERQKTS